MPVPLQEQPDRWEKTQTGLVCGGTPVRDTQRMLPGLGCYDLLVPHTAALPWLFLVHKMLCSQISLSSSVVEVELERLFCVMKLGYAFFFLCHANSLSLTQVT